MPEPTDPEAEVIVFLLSTVAYGIVAVGTFLFGQRLRRPRSRVGPDHIDPVQLAYLSGGRESASNTAIGMLRAAGLIDAENGILRAVSAIHEDLSGLEQAIHRSLTEHPEPIFQLRRRRVMRRALNDIRQELERTGLYVGRWARVLYLGSATVLCVGAFIGSVYALSYSAESQNAGLGMLVFAAMTVIPLTSAISLFEWQAVTEDGRRLMEAESDGVRPGASGLGRISIGMATAVHGTTVLFKADPTFVQEARIPLPNTYRSTSDHGGGGGFVGGGGDGGGGDGGGGGA